MANPVIEQRNLEQKIGRTIDERFLDINIGGVGNQSFPFVTPPDEDTTTLPSAVNYIDNSELDYSSDAYLNTVPSGGDDGFECYNFYRQRFIRVTDAVFVAASDVVTSASNPFLAAYSYPMYFFAIGAGTGEATLVGTLTRDNDGQATMSLDSEKNITDGELWFSDGIDLTTTNALKSTGHSAFAANEGANDSIARWDKTVGQAEIGSDAVENWDMSIPLPLNLATPGLPFFLSVNVRLRTGATQSTPVTLFAGIFNTTTGEEQFLEGENFSLSVTVEGTPGTTEYECVVVGTFSNGSQVISDVFTISTAPDTFDASNYLYWNWENAPNILDFALYRKDTSSGITVRVFTIYNGETAFFDKNESGENTVPDLPTLANRRARAYVESLAFTPTSSWVRVLMFFSIPPTYDPSGATGRQVLRVGVLTNNLDSARPVLMDRFMLSFIESSWNRSPRDLSLIATQVPTSTNPDGNQGNTGIIRCFHENTPVVVLKNEKWQSILLKDAEKGMFISSGAGTDRIVGIKDGYSNNFFYVELENGIFFECTASERFITSRADRNGTLITTLSVGDELLSCVRGRIEKTRIKVKSSVYYDEPQKVRTLSLQSGKIFIAGEQRLSWCRKLIKLFSKTSYNQITGALAHNAKSGDPDVIF